MTLQRLMTNRTAEGATIQPCGYHIRHYGDGSPEDRRAPDGPVRGQGFTLQRQGYGVMPVTVAKPGDHAGLVLSKSADCVAAPRSSTGGLGHRMPTAYRCTAAGGLSGSREIGGAGRVVGGHGEPGLETGIGQTSPAHSPKAVRPLPSPKDRFDPGADAAVRLVPLGQPAAAPGPCQRQPAGLTPWHPQTPPTAPLRSAFSRSGQQSRPRTVSVTLGHAALPHQSGVGPSRTSLVHASFQHRIGRPKPRQPLPPTGLPGIVEEIYVGGSSASGFWS